MAETRRYEFDGLILDVPIHYDDQANMYIEDYPDFVENPTFTSKGHRVFFAGTDACSFAEERTPGGCPDCGGCRHYRRLSEHTWIGVCQHSYHRRE